MPYSGQHQRWRDVVITHRLEYPLPVNYLCYGAWGAGFAVREPRALLSAPVLCGVVANVLFIVSALALNTSADIHTDQRHEERGYVASAALRIGRGRLLAMAAVELLVGMILAVAVSVLSGQWFVLAAAASIIMLQVLYNVEPVRLKRHGFLGVSAFCTAVVGLPFVLSHLAAGQRLTTSIWPILVGLNVLTAGRMTWWSVPDRVADAATGMHTPSVRHGPGRTVVLALSLMVAGLVLIGWGLWRWYGFAWAVPPVTAHGAALMMLGRVAEPARSSSVQLQRRALPPVMIGDLVLLITPLAAGPTPGSRFAT